MHYIVDLLSYWSLIRVLFTKLDIKEVTFFGLHLNEISMKSLQISSVLLVVKTFIQKSFIQT